MMMSKKSGVKDQEPKGNIQSPKLGERSDCPSLGGGVQRQKGIPYLVMSFKGSYVMYIWTKVARAELWATALFLG